MNNDRIRASPPRKNSIGTGWNFPKRGTRDNREEGIAHFGIVRLELALNIDDKNGCDYGEQTSLSPRKRKDWHSNRQRTMWKTYEDQRGGRLIVVLADKIVVKFVGFAFEHLVELDMSTRVGKGVGCFRGMMV